MKEIAAASDDVCEIMSLLSNRSRLMILCVLSEGEMSVGALAEAIGARDTVVSQQLAVLRRERIVKSRRDGQTIFYRIVRDDIGQLLEFLFATYCHDAANSEENEQ